MGHMSVLNMGKAQFATVHGAAEMSDRSGTGRTKLFPLRIELTVRNALGVRLQRSLQFSGLPIPDFDGEVIRGGGKYRVQWVESNGIDHSSVTC